MGPCALGQNPLRLPGSWRYFWNGLDLSQDHQMLSRVFRSIQGRIHPVSMALFQPDTAICPAKPALSKSKILICWPDLWRHHWPSDKISQYIPKVHARGYQLPLWIANQSISLADSGVRNAPSLPTAGMVHSTPTGRLNVPSSALLLMNSVIIVAISYTEEILGKANRRAVMLLFELICGKVLPFYRGKPGAELSPSIVNPRAPASLGLSTDGFLPKAIFRMRWICLVCWATDSIPHYSESRATFKRFGWAAKRL